MAKKETPSVSARFREDLIRENEELRQQLKEIKKIQEKKDNKRVQKARKKIRKKFYSILDKIADPLFIYDAVTYRFLHCNESFTKNFGYSEEDIFSLTPFDLYKPEDFEKVRENIDRRTVDTPITFTFLTKDRRQRIVEIMTEDIFFEGNPAWMTVVHDITEHIATEEELKKSRHRLEEMVDKRNVEVMIATRKLRGEIEERKKAEDAIRESEVKFRNIIEKSLDGIILVDEKGSIIEWNRGQETIYGTKRAMVAGKKIWDVQFQHEPQAKRVDENYKEIKSLWENFFKTGINPFQNKDQVSQIERPDGQIRDIQQLNFTIEPDKGLMMACTTRDITDRLDMERQLYQVQKMEAMGTLAGGIAHDFNNILGGILGYTELAIRKLEKKSPIQKYLKQVLTASRRASDLVKQILIFSRREKKEKEPVQMSLIVKEAVKLLRSSLPATIEIVSKIEDDESFILADATQIHQVMMNLCTNAAHAMKEKGGIMEVRLNKEKVEVGLYKELKAGPHLRLSISDTGYGIKQEMIDKIFEPFYTTKDAGEGTGMGLAVVHGIVKSYNGNISTYSKEGEGTTFSLLFPIIVDVIHIEKKQEETIQGGNERILLVEDDASLADAEKKLFEELGYNVTKVTSGVEAFEIFRKVPERFDIVITDYSMPKMTGGELINKIRSINPDVPVILCTGFTNVITQQKASTLGIGDIITKPIELGAIAKSIRKLLEKK